MMFRCLLLTLTLLSAALPVLATPQINAPQQSFSFGEVYQGEKVTHTFGFTNTGDTPLAIEKVRSSCGCTAVMVSKKTLQPGEAGEVQATFDSSRFRGPVTKKIYLYSNATGAASFDFLLTATVKEIISLTPHMVSSGPLPPEKAFTVDIVMTNQWKAPVNITSVQTGLETLHARLERETLEVGEQARLTLSITPGREKRRLNTYVILKTDIPLLPEIRIPVNLVVNQAG